MPFLFIISSQTIRVFGTTPLRFVSDVPSRVESRVAILSRILQYSSIVKTRILYHSAFASFQWCRRTLPARRHLSLPNSLFFSAFAYHLSDDTSGESCKVSNSPRMSLNLTDDSSVRRSLAHLQRACAFAFESLYHGRDGQCPSALFFSGMFGSSFA